jgi:DNA-binding MarR family transcriptional regulator
MDAGPIAQVRRFNRLVTQRVEALQESYLRRGRPLGEARLIFETRAEGAELRALRDRLGLDSGYLSRLLRSLEAQGLVTVEGESTDRRRRWVRLTSEGRAELAAYDRLSDELAASMHLSHRVSPQARCHSGASPFKPTSMYLPIALLSGLSSGNRGAMHRGSRCGSGCGWRG